MAKNRSMYVTHEDFEPLFDAVLPSAAVPKVCCKDNIKNGGHTSRYAAISLPVKSTQPRFSHTRSRNSLPALKCGTYLAGNFTCAPVLGLRPWRGGREFNSKLPKPRISIRPPRASVEDNASRITFTASSASLATSCGCSSASFAIKSERVMFITSSLIFSFTAAHLGFQQCAQISRTGVGRITFRREFLHRGRFFGLVERLDRQVDTAILAIHVDDDRRDGIALFEMGANIFNTIRRDFGCLQIGFHITFQRNHGTLGIQRFDRAGNHCAFFITGNKTTERITFHLFDTQ